MVIIICIISDSVRWKILFAVPMNRVFFEIVIAAVDPFKAETVSSIIIGLSCNNEAFDIIKAAIFSLSDNFINSI